jgi:uncharacterized protein
LIGSSFAMLELASKMADKIGCVGVVVDAKPGAIDFYTRYGFTPFEVLEGHSETRPRATPMCSQFRPSRRLAHPEPEVVGARPDRICWKTQGLDANRSISPAEAYAPRTGIEGGAMNNLATVQQIYQAFGRGDVPAIVETLTENVEWEHDAVDHGIPWLVPGRGKSHVLSFFGVVQKELEISRFDVTSILGGGDQIVAVISIEATVRSTGKRVRDFELHFWTFDERGKVSKFRHVVDTHQHWLAAQP